MRFTALAVMLSCTSASPLQPPLLDRGRLRRLGVTVLLMVCGCGADGSTQSAIEHQPDAGPKIEGCEDVLVDARDNLPTCFGEGDPAARCAQAEREPDRELAVWIRPDAGYIDENGNEVEVPLATRLHLVDCTVRYAESLGILARTEATRDSFTIEARFTELKKVFALDWITRVSLLCPSKLDGCEICWSHDETACQNDAFCRAIDGNRIDEERSCIAGGFAGCMPGDNGCNSAWWATRSPAGECWIFSNGCFPQGFTEADESPDAGASACTLSLFDSLAQCGP